MAELLEEFQVNRVKPLSLPYFKQKSYPVPPNNCCSVLDDFEKIITRS
jgi:hypothetical protein